MEKQILHKINYSVVNFKVLFIQLYMVTTYTMHVCIRTHQLLIRTTPLLH